jgi:CheY-like chemotaxis protein
VKILHIDDNKEITDMFLDLLPSLGFEYMGINDPGRGIQEIKEKKYDFVFLDIHMPEFSGIDVIQILENESILKSQKIIIFSGAEFSPNEINDLLKKEGIYGHLKKPILFNELLRAITV